MRELVKNGTLPLPLCLQDIRDMGFMAFRPCSATVACTVCQQALGIPSLPNMRTTVVESTWSSLQRPAQPLQIMHSAVLGLLTAAPASKLCTAVHPSFNPTCPCRTCVTQC